MTPDPFPAFRLVPTLFAGVGVPYGHTVLIRGRLDATAPPLAGDAFDRREVADRIGWGSRPAIRMPLDFSWRTYRRYPLPDRFLSPGESGDDSCFASFRFPDEPAAIPS